MAVAAKPAPISSRSDPASQEAQRLSCLVSVAQVINSSLELSQVLEHILSQASDILHAESGSIMLMDESTRQLRVLAARGPRAEEIMGRHQALGEGVAGWVAQHGKPRVLHGRASDACFRRVCDRLDIRDALCVPLRAEEQVLGVISLNNRLSAASFTDADLELLIAISNQAALAIRNAKSFHEMRRQRQTVERLLEELTRAQEHERSRIALLLHDGPAQTMFAALRNLETVRALTTGSTGDLDHALVELEHTVRAAISETRAVMVDLRPLCLDDIGLFSALRQYGVQFQTRSGIRTHVQRKGLDRRLPGMLESCFYRIAQEALTNVWKHSGARNARVTLSVEETSTTLEIHDDGKGFDPDEVAARKDQHLGMMSLKDRAELAGGVLHITCAPGEGTTVRVSAPTTSPLAAAG